MHMAVYNDDVTDIKRLLSSGADPNVPDDVGNIPLHVAVSHKFSYAAQLLVESAVTVVIIKTAWEKVIFIWL